ncbi:MAG: nuclear transport factor 2 family protein [Wenzhouxiangellaceae bacterium]
MRAAWAGVLIVMLAGCGAELDDETRIRQILDDMIEALEQGDVGDFMAPVAEDFVAVNGRLDRRALGLLVRRERLARDAIRVRRVDTEIELVGDSRARVSFRALATGGSGLLPDEGRLWRVETGWRRDDGEWKLISAEWE